MTLGVMLAIVLGVFVVGSTAYWVIRKFLPAESHTVALAIVGVLLLLIIVLLDWFFPNVSGIRVW